MKGTLFNIAFIFDYVYKVQYIRIIGLSTVFELNGVRVLE